jgi:hypothetical protein
MANNGFYPLQTLTTDLFSKVEVSKSRDSAVGIATGY